MYICVCVCHPICLRVYGGVVGVCLEVWGMCSYYAEVYRGSHTDLHLRSQTRLLVLIQLT